MNPFLSVLGLPDPDDENPFIRALGLPPLGVPRLGADIEAAGGMPALGPDPEDRERSFGDYANRFVDATRAGAASIARMPGDAARSLAQTFAPTPTRALPEGAEILGPGSYSLPGEDGIVRHTAKAPEIAHPYDYYLGEGVADTAFQGIDEQNEASKEAFRSRRGNPFLTAALDTGVEAASMVADPTNWIPASEAAKAADAMSAAGKAARIVNGSILDMPVREMLGARTVEVVADRAAKISERRLQALVDYRAVADGGTHYEDRLAAWARTQGVEPESVTPDLEEMFLRLDSPEGQRSTRETWLNALPPAERAALEATDLSPSGPAARGLLDTPLREAVDYLRAAVRGNAGSFEGAAQADALEPALARPLAHPLAPPPASGEAGFIQFRATPPPPPRPIRQYMLTEEPGKSGADMVRDFGRRWAQQVTNADDPVDRYGRIGRRKGAPAPELGRRLETAVAGLRGSAELARGPITRGTRLFDPGTGDYVYTGESARNILGGMDQRSLTDLEDFLVASRQVELAQRADDAGLEWAKRLADRRAEVEKLRLAGNTQRAGARALEGDARRAMAADLRATRADAKGAAEERLREVFARGLDRQAGDLLRRSKSASERAASAAEGSRLAGVDFDSSVDLLSAAATRAREMVRYELRNAVHRPRLGEIPPLDTRVGPRSPGAVGDALAQAAAVRRVAERLGVEEGRLRELLARSRELEGLGARARRGAGQQRTLSDAAAARRGAVDAPAARGVRQRATTDAFAAGRQVAKDEAKRKAAQLRLPRAERPADLALQVNAQATADARSTLADIAQTWGPRMPELEAVARRYQDWKVRATLDPLVEIGWMTPAARQAVLASNQSHVMFARAVDGVYAHILDERVTQGLMSKDEALVELFGREASQVVAAGSTKGEPLKRISAGLGDNLTGLIKSGLESDLTKVQATHRWIERQRVRNILGDLADVDPVIAREIVPTGKKITAAPFMSKEEFGVWRNGEMHGYVAPSDTLQALEHLTPRQVHWAMKIARLPAKVVRTTATLGIEFMMRNPVRDVASAMVSSESGFLPQDFVYGLLSQMPGTGGPQWLRRARGMADEWASSGGAMSTMAQMDTAAARATLADATQGRGAIEAIRGGLRHWREEIRGDWLGGTLYPLQVASGVAEKATRVGVYANARRGGRKQIAGLAIPGTRGGAPKSMVDAMAEARDATIDFGRAGEAGRVVNSLYAFANAEIQDVSKLYRNLRDRPVDTTVRLMAYVVAPSAVGWYLNRDDPDYRNRQEWEKVVYLHGPKLPSGETLRLPRPAGIVNALFSYGMEKLFEQIAGDDPRAADKLVQGLTEMTPAHWASPADWVPTAAKGPVQAAYNYDDFRQQDIDPSYQQQFLPQFRGMDDENLPQVFKDASQGINAAFPGLERRGGRAYEMTSPYRLQHVFRAYTTSFGRYATDALRAADQDPATRLPTNAADTPGLRAFVGRRPIGWSSKPVSDVYAIHREATAAKETADELRKSGRINEWMKLQSDHPELKLYGQITATRSQLNAWKKLRDQMKAAPGMTPEARQNMLMQWDQMATSYSATQLQWMAPLLER